MTRKERIFARLRELGAEPKRSLGQNFLISDHVVNRILAAAESAPFTDLVEVGPGLGAITEDLLGVAARSGASLTLLELDTKFAAYWRERGVRVMECDALQADWTSLGLRENSLFVSNLPYQISSSIVIERSLEPAGITRMILMFQKEVAQRLAAKKSSKDYGLLTVIAQTFWDISTVCDASPGDFYPPPNVASRVLQFRRKPDPFAANAGPDADFGPGQNVAAGTKPTAAGFLKFAKAGFAHRRKLLSRNLMGEYYGGRKELLPELEKAFAEQGLLATARAEELDPKTFVELYRRLMARNL
jgi:16S rRNA (adenine1518-N6/adenine1519-N6)-dimethyltransferase